MTERIGYGVAALAVFGIEAAIALFVHDSFVRPHLGDVLAVALVYLVLRAATPLRMLAATLLAVGVAFAIEFGQLFDLLHRFGLAHFRVARVVLGSSFDLADLLAYVVGGAAIVAVETIRTRP